MQRLEHFLKTVEHIDNDRSKIWNSFYVEVLYSDNGGGGGVCFG